MIKLIQFNRNSLEQLRLLNDKNGEQITILPGFGSSLNELVLSKKSKLYSLLDGNPSKKEIVGDKIYKGARLIPFPNRVADGKYEFEGSVFQLACNEKGLNNALHGFLFDKEFTIENVEESESRAKVELVYDYSGNITGYPFPFKAKIIYSLSEKDGFTCSTMVKNTGDSRMPFGDGFHPFFTFHSKVDDLWLKLPVDQKIIINEQMVPTGERIDYKNFHKLSPIGLSEFDSCFSVQSGEQILSTELYNPGSEATIRLWQETGPDKYNYLQIYIPPHRNSIAIEPVTSNVNAFNNKEGLIVLEQDQHFEAKYGIQLV
ncbi:MAG: hypothetical protein D8M58_09385 [Calditrichaeota bacterium]|nr:MAG: hypothetical protein DWQ03_08760 [Calditrichota bacterium]MBL1205599.1 hypothetical protein [Calditrichota bacterium]NOG45428.1 hypothetical protein [Calditrichota bacterium]